MKGISTNTIALIALLTATLLMAFLFIESRLDPSLRIAALVSGTGLVSTLSAIASTMLTGKDLSKGRDPSDLPPNTTVADSSTIHTGPVGPTQPQ